MSAPRCIWSLCSYIFCSESSETTYGASYGRGNKISIKGSVHMTKMAVMPIYGKILYKSSSPEAKDL